MRELKKRMSKYCGDDFKMAGLQEAVKLGGCSEDHFFSVILPCIVGRALALPQAKNELQDGVLRILRHGKRDRLTLSRELGASLLANMFLGSFDAIYAGLPRNDCMPSPSFRDLFSSGGAGWEHEVAKLRMFIHYFERVGSTPLRGKISIDRVTGVAPSVSEWFQSKTPLLPLEMAPPRVGFESAPELAHADFANMFIGGGALSGGCVQEEIRFSICPELCLSMLICPCMLADEAIQITGAQQFSAYTGYGFKLGYGGDHRDVADLAPDGSVYTAVLAMDAMDLRGRDSSLLAQLGTDSMLRDLNKSVAAFAPFDAESLTRFPVIATGNWGCGEFQGCPQLKALVQWASASHCGRRLRYFPFEQQFGPELQKLSREAVGSSITVGQLLSVLRDLHTSETALNGQPPKALAAAPAKPAKHARPQLFGDALFGIVSGKLQSY